MTMTRLLTQCALVLLTTTCLVLGQEEPPTDQSGPCEDVTPPCDVPRNHSHARNCSLFWECAKDATQPELRECPRGTRFDMAGRACSKDATCTSCTSRTATPIDGFKDEDAPIPDKEETDADDGYSPVILSDEPTGDPENEPELLNSGDLEEEDLAPKKTSKPVFKNENAPGTDISFTASGTDTSEQDVPLPEPETEPKSSQPNGTNEDEDPQNNEEPPTILTNTTTGTVIIEPSTTTTTLQALSTTPPPPPTTTTTKPTTTTTKLEKSSSGHIIIPDIPVPSEPPYQILPGDETVTPKAANTTSGLDTPADKVKIGGLDKKLIIIVSAAAAGVVVIIIVIVVVVVVCRRRQRRKKHEIQIIENPRYRGAASSGEEGKNYRFSRDASIYVGNLSNQRIANNNSDEKVDMNSQRTKRRAPAPPNPFTGQVAGYSLGRDSIQYYEKDTPTGSEVELTTFGTQRQVTSPPKDGGSVAADGPREAASGFMTDDSDSDDNRLDDTTDNEPETEALLDGGSDKDLDFRLPNANRQSIADKYRFSDDEDSHGFGRGSLADRYRYSDDDLETPRSPPYELDDIKDELETPDFSEEDDDRDRTENPFLS